MNEDILISFAIERESRGRYRALPSDSNGRKRLLDKLNHNPPLDPRYTKWFSSFQKALDSITVDPNKQVYLLSSAKEIDGATMPFAIAIEKVRFHGWGTIIGISPTLALYYGEEGESGAVIEKTV